MTCGTHRNPTPPVIHLLRTETLRTALFLARAPPQPRRPRSKAKPKRRNPKPLELHPMAAWPGAAALVVAILAAAARGGAGKTTIEPCAGADTCAALLGYTLYADMKVSEVAALFGADPRALLAANALDFASPGAANRILPAGLPLRVPTRCACSDGVRKSVAVRYSARPADTLASVADVVFAGLASADQIRTANGLSAEDPDAPLDAGATLVIPLPCVCFNSTDNNLPAVYLSYVVRVGDTVQSVAASHATTVTDISNVNAMGSPIVAPGDILAIPLPACASTFPNSASDYGLLVANGTYALTAGNCVQCSCGPGDLKLYCTPASLTASCSSMQCPNSNLMLGNVTAQSTSGGCNVSSCSYAGLVNGTIATSLSSGLQPTCPGPHQFPPLTATPIAVNQGSYLAPSPAPGAGEAGGDIPGLPGSSNVSPANGPSGSVSQAASVNRPHQIVALILFVALYFQM
uniref:LysM domain-containing protein n=1 Tax=Oryza punctata TaxID=4537 RepID=A0A0E0L964_ORYPU